MDYSKAFDNVKWSKLWEILISMGVPYHLVFLIQQVYRVYSSTRVRIDGNLSGETATRKGVRRGCVLSPILFNIYSEFVMRQEELVALLNILEQHSAACGLDREHDKHREIKSVGRCGSCENEIWRRIQQARVAKLTKIWRDHNITKATKMSLVQSHVFSIFLYASESWIVKKAQRVRIDAFEIWTWRRMLRVTYTPNVSILDELGNPKRLSCIVSTTMLTFFGHIHRSDNMEKLEVQGRAPSGRRHGRSPTRCVDTTKQLLDMSIKSATVNRERWRATVLKTIENIRVGNTLAPTYSIL
ncbi:unnamed protein product [Callosobruchus maculatus]|uniref:Reverse transcriptase domain-containing protein n=1 Tax=Callosobruchus maculatus TaxID=64391 RepID=A0A653BPW9_CALMS|nr:unnamed protein product [Callosobruchus maculatus]